MTLENLNDNSFSQAITKLRQLTQLAVQNNWLSYGGDLPLEAIDFSQGQTAPLNEGGYITWPGGRCVQWLAQKLTIPPSLQAYPLAGLALRLVLTWWAGEAKIFVNGNLVQEGDLFESSARILLTPSAVPGEEILVALRLVSPGHDIGALMRSQLVYERNWLSEIQQNPKLGIQNLIDPGFVADELTVLHQYLAAFEPEKLEDFATVITQINWQLASEAAAFHRSLNHLRQTLQPLAENIKQRCFYLLGHAHLDLAWLWTVNETWEVAQRTFQSVLNLQQEYPYLTFGHTSPVLYAWLEKNRPDLFQGIQEAVKAKSWEILGGMWVEPEVNIVSGESLVRQVLYGQRYIEEKFGAATKIAWLPDSFGFTWQLPQILKGGGIAYFVTGKLHWNDTTKFPHGVFWWQSPDGTEIFTLMSPPNVTGVMDTNPLTMANYAIDWERKTGLPDIFWLPGVGDRGGGPTRDMLEVQKRWQHSPFFPQSKFATASEYLAAIGSKISEEQKQVEIPIWQDELYLEFHRGCYTTHAEQKYFNRRCEALLYEAELWSSLASILLGRETYPYPQQELEGAWQKVLFNQFHDILPGTSIPEVFVEANKEWQEAISSSEKIINQSLRAIAAQIDLPTPPHPEAKPLLVFNSLNWQRTEVVSCPVAHPHWQVYNLAGEKLLSQVSADNSLLFLAEDIPSVGYRIFWLCPASRQEVGGVTLESESDADGDSDLEFILDNNLLRVKVNSETGDLASIFDKINQREILQGSGNQLQGFRDSGQYWDAWNIDPEYAKHPLSPTQLKSIAYLETGPVQWKIRAIRQLESSEFCQDYILQVGSPILKITTTVNWQASHVLVKAAFPLNLNSERATYEIPFAAIARTTQPQTPVEKAKWEVSALRWADLTDLDRNYGVSILNDSKYGYDAQSDRLRLTLLRSSQWPAPHCDRGSHQFTYAVYPHPGSWQEARTVHRGYELNVPLQVLVDREIGKAEIPCLPAVSQLLNLSAPNLILSAFKQSESHPARWILRCYECQGEKAELRIESDWELALLQSVNFLEQPGETSDQYNQIYPWKIASFECAGAPSKPPSLYLGLAEER